MLDQGYSVSELLVIGFSGKTISPSTLTAFRKEKVSQFILFSQNYESKEQLIALTDQLQSISSENQSTLPAIVSADQEGGRVQRFKEGFTLIPSALSIGNLNSPNKAYEISQIQARELFAAGIQLNFAPVCDINTNPKNPVIGERAYGATVEQVTKTVTAVVRGHLTEQVEVCLKHFPGHGDTHIDSHLSLPTVTTPLETLRAREWVPFQKAMKSGANFVMSAHVLLPHLDENYPGTFSPTFLEAYLRKDLLFQGVIISDDMEMGAVINRYGANEAPILALNAGCNLLCYRSEEHGMIAIEAIKKAIQDKKLNESKIKSSIDRTRKIRSKLKLASQTLSQNDRVVLIGSPTHHQCLHKHYQ